MALTPLVMTDVRIYYDSLDATGFSNHVELSPVADVEDMTTFGSGGGQEEIATGRRASAMNTVIIPLHVQFTLRAQTALHSFDAEPSLQGQVGSGVGAVTDAGWRVIWAISGSSPSFLFAVSAGVASK